jgi:hypothetical protein
LELVTNNKALASQVRVATQELWTPILEP